MPSTPSPAPIRLAAQALTQRVGEGSVGLSPIDPPSSDFGATSAERESAARGES
jgi:hypothetical protein